MSENVASSSQIGIIEDLTKTIINTIYLVRHGESIGNVQRLFLSAEDDVLSPNGKKQVDLLGKHLADVKFTRMYSSNYPRALDTAEAILSHSKYYSDNSAVIIEQDSRLRERSYGILEGASYQEGFRQFQLANVPILEFEIPEGELVQEIVLRMTSFMKELCDELENSDEPETVSIVSHSFAIVSLLHWLTQSKDYNLINWDIEKDFKMLGNASYMKILVEKKLGLQMGPRDLNFLKINECSHLKELNASSGSFSSFTQSTEEAKGYKSCVQQ